MQTFREIASFVIGLIVWAVCIFGPLALLFARMPLFAIIASASSIAAFALSFRWRNGYVLILGCFGMMLLLYNTLTLCIASALIAKDAGLSAPVQIGIGAAGIPIVIALVQGVERSANYLLGPVAPDCEIGAGDQSDGG
ncbi:MAG: hypothetical protein ACK56J_05600 [Planctomycetota bacterium]